MNIALWAGFLTSLLLISHIDGKIKNHGTVFRKSSHKSRHDPPSYSPPHYNPPPPSYQAPHVVYQKHSWKNAAIQGAAAGGVQALTNNVVNRVLGSGSESSHNTVNHYYTNQAVPAPGTVVVTSSEPGVSVVKPESHFPTVYIIIIVVGCVVAAIVLFLVIKLLV